MKVLESARKRYLPTSNTLYFLGACNKRQLVGVFYIVLVNGSVDVILTGVACISDILHIR